jgi:hypothetical protein
MRTPLKTGGELKGSGRIIRSCSTSGSRRVNLVTDIIQIKIISVSIRQELKEIKAFIF